MDYYSHGKQLSPLEICKGRPETRVDICNETDGMITEKDFRQQVIDAAKLCSWKCQFHWTSIHSPAGFPDLVLVKPPRVLFAELKVGERKMTLKQAEWIEALLCCPGVETYIWRPPVDSVVEVLKNR